MSKYVFLIFDLLQDVNVQWPIAQLVARETPYRLGFLISDRFVERDSGGRWLKELEELGDSTSAEIHRIRDELGAYDAMAGKHGIIFAGSESNLGAHSTSHNIFRSAPAEFVKATLQHGFECIGLLQNRAHCMAHGQDVRFAADVVCTWMEPEKLLHLQPSERPKVYVTGPPALLLASNIESGERSKPGKAGLVCENLHSVRMNAAGDFKSDFVETFTAFSKAMGKRRKPVTLRPHPGGQYVIRNGVKLPANMTLNNEPMYRIELGQYAYGISAPSSVLIDMVLAGVPTAVWQDEAGVIDVDSYAGLTRISNINDWTDFAEAAVSDRDAMLERQRQFLADTGILADPVEVRNRFLSLIHAACSGAEIARAVTPLRVLFVANGLIPTLEIAFVEPLKPLVEAGLLETRLLTEQLIVARANKAKLADGGKAWAEQQIEEFKPDLAVFCRYSGVFTKELVERLHFHDVPVIFHIDDDLLNVPIELGEAKFRNHNRPERLSAVRHLLNNADYVYCSNQLLEERMRAQGFNKSIGYGKIHSTGEILRPTELRPVRKVGYMGFDKVRDLQMILPQLVTFLRTHQAVKFELFGAFDLPSELLEFGGRVKLLEPVRPYSAFMPFLADLDWDIGICPLLDTPFNRVKTNTKWIEYTMVGAAVIATGGMAYEECCDDNCGVLVRNADGWLEALDQLASDPDRRYRIATNAQQKMCDQYSRPMLRRQVLETFDLAQRMAARRILNAA
jgi:glycosyltransferase involved in cell wall biosynthesis